jgi:hypothetical protein
MRCTYIPLMAMAAGLCAAQGATAADDDRGPAVAMVRAQAVTDLAAPRYDDATGLWFTKDLRAPGEAASEVKGRDFSVRKTHKGGRIVLQVKAGKDSLTVSVASNAIEIRTRKRVVRFDPTRATEDHYHSAKAALAESRVVGRLRASAAALSAATTNSAEGFDFLLTEAIVAILDGDPSPVERLKARVRNQVVGVGMQAVRRAIGDCYDQWRGEALDAMLEAESCVNDFPIWDVVMRNLCYLNWTMRAEAAWFEFVGCSLGTALRLR